MEKETVIDYVLRDRTAWERVRTLEGGEIDSDHRSVTIRFEGGIRGEKREERGKKEGK